MFKEIVDDVRRTPDIGPSQKLTMSTLCSGQLKTGVQLVDAKARLYLNVWPLVTFEFNPLPDDKILDWSKFKQIADNILKCILNGIQIPYRV